jgi:hypothetical protein
MSQPHPMVLLVRANHPRFLKQSSSWTVSVGYSVTLHPMGYRSLP